MALRHIPDKPGGVWLKSGRDVVLEDVLRDPGLSEVFGRSISYAGLHRIGPPALRTRLKVVRPVDTPTYYPENTCN